MNPHHLELFYHVAKSKGVSRAARQMTYGIQQPSVSAQVNALERDLGVRLYERRPFQLTPAGEELFQFVQPFFGRIEEVRERLQGGAQIRIGASPIVFRDYLVPLIEVLRRRFPKLSLVLRALNQPELVEAIEQDELDVVLSLIPDGLVPGVRTLNLVQLPLVLLIPRSSKVTHPEALWTAERIEEALISLGPKELISQRFQAALKKLGVYWTPKIEMDSLELIEQYVAAGYGIGLSVRTPGKRFPAEVRVLELAEIPPVTLGALYRREGKPDGGAREAFLAEIQKAASKLELQTRQR